MEISRESISWVIGGPQGSGVDSASHIFLKSIAMSGLNVFGKREYHSNIKGEHSYFSVRFSDQRIRSHVDEIDMLVTFDAETIVRHSPFLVEGSILIYDPEVKEKKIEDIHTLDESSVNKIKQVLNISKKAFNFTGILEELLERKVFLIEMPYLELIKKFSEEIQDQSLSKLARITNVMSLAASLAALDFEIPLMEKGILDTFINKPKIAEINVKAANYAYIYVKENFGKKLERFSNSIKFKSFKSNNTIIAQGNQTSPLGKIVSGCRFQTYYPITPATDDSEYLESNQIVEQNDKNNGSIVVIQTEDEIAAITMAIGAALTGVRSCSTTSGPGFSLMAEALGWAGINEVPLVISLYQRAGPSTGLPTRQEQGDLLFSIYAGHGEFPRIVYSSGDIEESFYDTFRVFNYAEIFQLPVIHLLDKFISNSIITCDRFEYKNLKIQRGKYLNYSIEKKQVDPSDHFKRFKISDDPVSIRVPLGTENGIFWNTGDEHDESGHITEDPETRNRMMEKRLSKLDLIIREIPKEEQISIEFGNSNNPNIKKLIIILSWGSTKGAILDAIEKIAKQESTIQFLFLQIKLLNPFPSELLNNIIKDNIEKLKKNTGSSDFETIITIVEMNYLSQLDLLIKQNTTIQSDYNILKYNGRPMSHTEIHNSLINILRNKSSRRVILRNGV